MGLSDFETVQQLRCDLRQNAACGLGCWIRIQPVAFDHFRRQLARSGGPDRLFAKARHPAGGGGRGVLKGKHRRTLGSTVLDDAVAIRTPLCRSGTVGTWIVQISAHHNRRCQAPVDAWPTGGAEDSCSGRKPR